MSNQLIEELELIKKNNAYIYSDLKNESLSYLIIKYPELTLKNLKGNLTDFSSILSDDKNYNAKLLIIMMKEHKNYNPDLFNPLLHKSNLNFINEKNESILSLFLIKYSVFSDEGNNWNFDLNFSNVNKVSHPLLQYIIENTDSNIYNNELAKEKLQSSLSTSFLPQEIKKTLKEKFDIETSFFQRLKKFFKFSKKTIYLHENKKNLLINSINEIQKCHLTEKSFEYFSNITKIFNLYETTLSKDNTYLIEMNSAIKKIPDIVNSYLLIDKNFRNNSINDKPSANELLDQSLKNIFENFIFIQKNIIDEQYSKLNILKNTTFQKINEKSTEKSLEV